VEEVAAHPPAATKTSAKPVGHSNYLFVNNVRFMSMLAIVWVHAETLWGTSSQPTAHYLQLSLLQFLKFGTIGFFLISGFLMGEGVTRSSPATYFRRRVKAILLPWAFWGFIWFLRASRRGPRRWPAWT